eukprot:TRINITY_DN61698_c0_g1_i1.p1 TRINITY_DN61698_c0_g1~~TRINITY_DN61698_c0_g1_i1.p1  ORF type:complete len:576 (+),score=145.75 TRINITY_DN61698_c0_g1_i1:93-1820(+)
MGNRSSSSLGGSSSGSQSPAQASQARGQDSQARGSKEEANAPEVPQGSQDIRQKYQIQHVLGSGTFGEVRQVTLLSDPKVVRAVKVIEQGYKEAAEDSDGWGADNIFQREVELLQAVQHKNIVQFWDVYEDKHFLYVVMDLCRGGEVFARIVELRVFTEVDASRIAAQMIAALEYIHGRSIMHRDIKAENFLLTDKTSTAVVKMIDFGMAARFEHGQMFHDMCGSPHYLAPELIGQKYSYQVDMWALGILMYLMLFGKYPFDGSDIREIMLKILNGNISFRRKSSSPPLSNLALHMMQSCLEVKPRKRLSAEEAMSHPWVVKAGQQHDIPGSDSAPLNLKEDVQKADEVVQASRSKVPREISQRRANTLKKLEADFKKGICLGHRLGEPKEEDFRSKPESVRRSSRVMSAPGKQMQSLRAKVAAKVEAVVGRNKVKEGPCGEAEELGNPEQTAGKMSTASSSKASSSSQADARPAPQRRQKVAMTAQAFGRLPAIGHDELAPLRRLWEEWRRESGGGSMTTQEFFGLCPAQNLSRPSRQGEDEEEDGVSRLPDETREEEDNAAKRSKVETAVSLS